MPLTLGCSCSYVAQFCAVLLRGHALAAQHVPALAPGSPYKTPLTGISLGQRRERVLAKGRLGVDDCTNRAFKAPNLPRPLKAGG